MKKKKTKVLMFGWEFPPYSSGGLGTACYGLTKGLSNHGVEVTFVIPYAAGPVKNDFVKVISANNIKVKKIDSLLTPYMSSQSYKEILMGKPAKQGIYGCSLFEEVYRYSQIAKRIAKEEEFDIIHCHDWMTYKAGINAKKVSKKPLVLHIHATEFDRTAGNVNQAIYDAEREGFWAADKICAVSNFTKQKVAHHYGINPEKVVVVHNAVEFNEDSFSSKPFRINDNDKVVLFLGRITVQKGPEYFLYAAKKVLEKEKNVKFIVAGSGDMERFMIEKAAELGIADKVLFAGFLKGKDIDRAYQMADLYVMPSVSEPFGITPLEAMRNDTPVIISRQSGVSEVIKHCLKVDFWDINEMADKMIAVLEHNILSDALKENGRREVLRFSWNEPARKCIEVYESLIS